jgi:thiopurine S-methyltransferase
MEADFWNERWRDGQIGFHQPAPNAQMQAHWQRLALAGGSRVFVPLAGKSLDMVWLLAHGHKVLGVELNSLAVEAFFEENDIPAEREEIPGYQVFRSRSSERNIELPIELWCGDFFALKSEDLASVDAVYDRAALIALPPGMRAAYAAHMTRCLPKGAAMLLVTLEYPQAEMAGPPFSVSEAEVMEFYGADFDIERVGSVSLGPDQRPPSGQNLSEMFEKTYHLKPRKI